MPGVNPSGRTRQRGAVALLSVLLLCGLALLASLHAHRALLAELRGAQAQQRSAVAQEAAESGLQWALAQLNAGRVDAQCRPSADGDDPRWRDRLIDGAPSRPAPRLDDTGAPKRAGCALQSDGGWRCGCGGTGAPALATETPTFEVQFAATPRSGQVHLLSRGCLGCGGGELDARAEARALLALVPALAGLPAAPLTVRGELRLQTLALDLSTRERDAQGLLLHAGGAVTPAAPAPGAASGPGSGSAATVSERDPALALPPGRFLHRWLGLEPADFARAPGVRRLQCGAGDCAEALRAAVTRGAQALWIEGDLALPTGAVLGSADAPVLLAVQGRAALGPGVALHGLLAAGALRWDARPGGDFIRGAVLVNGDCCEGSGAPAIERDAALLRRLARQAGRYVAVPGSWRDFN
ncbi:hypothetical protein [Azohydromonas aeria]|uniref:hypothetical protein n=1 Tax=Azohydromonas aeria TaxID=2590212 RepID=UPI0012F9F484|nr:hypothetical protein [Azohydromonas aeria]